MDTNLRLCVGGPLDRQVVEGTVNRLACSENGSETYYHFERIRGVAGREFGLYVHDSLTPDQALERLLDVYAGKDFGRPKP